MNRRNNNKFLIAVVAVFAVVSISLALAVVSCTNCSEKQEKIPPHEEVNKPQNNKTQEQQKQENQPVIPEVPKENRVSFVAAGDNIIHDMVRNDAKNKASGSDKDFDFTSYYENIKDLVKEADLAFVNQEAPISGKDMGYSGYPNFNAPETAVYDLIETGFDVFNIANNHMLDKGTRGYANTVEFFSSLDEITFVGGYKNKEDYDNIRVVEKNGITIALLSYTYSTNGYSCDGSMYVPYTNSSEIDRQTKLAREMADFVAVSIHWGNENSFDVSGTQKQQMEIMVNNGVDVIIGTHPHVLQPMLWQDRPDGKKTLVMYSIGNLLSNMEQMKHHVGAVALFDFVKDEDGTRVENVSIIPTVCHFETDGNVNRDYKIYRLSEYTPELLINHARQNTGTDTRRDMNYLYDIVRENIPNEFLTEDFYRSY